MVLPNADLKPAYTYNLDISLTQNIAGRVFIELTGFYTLFKNAIIMAPYKLNGQYSIIHNGINNQVLASQNVNRSNLLGFTASFNALVSSSITFTSTLSYTKSRFKTDNTKTSGIYEQQPDGKYALIEKYVFSKPMDHIPPIMGKTSLVYKIYKNNTELYLLYNSWKHLDQYNADGEDNDQYATADGMPSWLTANWKGNFNFTKNIQLQVGVGNIFEKKLPIICFRIFRGRTQFYSFLKAKLVKN